MFNQDGVSGVVVAAGKGEVAVLQSQLLKNIVRKYELGMSGWTT